MLILRVGAGPGAETDTETEAGTMVFCAVVDSVVVVMVGWLLMLLEAGSKNGVRLSDRGTEGKRAVEKTKRSRGWEVGE